MERELLKAARRKQAKDELVKMRDSIRDSIAFAQATGKPIPEAYKEEQSMSQSYTERIKNMQKNTIDKTEKTLVDVHVEFENGSVLDIDEVYMDEIRMDTDRTMLVPEGSAMLHTINLDKVNYITYNGE